MMGKLRKGSKSFDLWGQMTTLIPCTSVGTAALTSPKGQDANVYFPSQTQNLKEWDEQRSHSHSSQCPEQPSKCLTTGGTPSASMSPAHRGAVVISISDSQSAARVTVPHECGTGYYWSSAR